MLAGQFVEEFGWSNLVVNDKAKPLADASANFQVSTLSLEPGIYLDGPESEPGRPDSDWSNYGLANLLCGYDGRRRVKAISPSRAIIFISNTAPRIPGRMATMH